MKTKSFFVLLCTIVLICSEMSWARGARSATGAAVGAMGGAAKSNFDKAKENKKKCDEKKEQAQGIEPINPGQAESLKKEAEKDCKKAEQNSGQGMGDLAKMLEGLKPQADTGDKQASNPLDSAIDSDEPMALFQQPELAQKVLEGAGLSAGLARSLIDGVNTASALGVSYDPKTDKVKTSLGEIPLSALSSPGAKAAFGFSPEEIKKDLIEQKVMADQLEEQLKKMGSGEDAGGGGGGSQAASNYDLPEMPSYEPNRNNMLSELNRSPGSDRQLTRVFDGDNIGVITDSIFAMVSRRYAKKRGTNFFLP